MKQLHDDGDSKLKIRESDGPDHVPTTNKNQERTKVWKKS